MDIFKTNGIKLTSIADGTVDDQASPLSLPSRNVAGYGKLLNENLVRLLENFADVTPPATSILGQLWFDTDDSQLYINTDRGFRPLALSYKTTSTPDDPRIGELWWDSSKKQLKTFDGSQWTVIGPGYESSWGETGIFPRLIRDSSGIDHLIVSIRIAGQDKLIINDDPEFTPNEVVAGFSTIKTGITVSSLVPDFLYNATVENSDNLGNISASYYVRKDQDSLITGQVTAESFGIGTDASSAVTVVGVDKNLVLSNTTADSAIRFDLNVGGNQTTVLALDPNGQVLLSYEPTNPQSAVTKNYLDSKNIETRNYVDSKFNDSKTYTDSKFDENGILPVSRGGTGADSVSGAREALYVPSITGTGATGDWDINITGTSANSSKLNNFTDSVDSTPNSIARRDNNGNLTSNIFYGVSSSAQYADLAEKYLADKEYEVGTVVMVGGTKEITACAQGHRAIGVISANPAYMMNSGLEGGQYVALKGRVPTKVLGPVKKGDLMLSGKDGAAQAGDNSANVFAIALESNDQTGVKLVECLVL